MATSGMGNCVSPQSTFSDMSPGNGSRPSWVQQEACFWMGGGGGVQEWALITAMLTMSQLNYLLFSKNV